MEASDFGVQYRSALFFAPCHSQAAFFLHLRRRRSEQIADSGAEAAAVARLALDAPMHCQYHW